jgi:hypothetical protein
MPWFGLVAEFSDEPLGIDVDRRSAARRTLRFESVLSGARAPSKVVVFDLSEAGLMLHAADELDVGETFAVELPERGAVEARVIWKRTTLYGCEFVVPVSRAVISAALLQAGHQR